MNKTDAKSNVQGPRAVPGVEFLTGQGGLPMLRVDTGFSEAEIYLQGAHVTYFRVGPDAPLLFLSAASQFAAGRPIRGGIPLILPWFGPREGFPAHGVARTQPWSVTGITLLPAGEIRVRFHLDCPEVIGFVPFAADFCVTVGRSLALELIVTNLSTSRDLVYEDCLHTYFSVGEISAVSIRGLQSCTYLDKVAGFASKTELGDAIHIASEVDRVYQDTASTVEIHDPSGHRKIIVAKEASASTVVWNPWIEKARQMSDFGDEEFHHMVCVESGNVGKNRRTLPPGQAANLRVRLSAAPLGS